MSKLSRALYVGRVAALEREILEKLRRSERVVSETGRNNSVDIPMRGPLAPLYAAAVSKILENHPELAVVKFHDNMTLCRRQSFQKGLSTEAYNQLETQGLMNRPGEGVETDDE